MKACKITSIALLLATVILSSAFANLQIDDLEKVYEIKSANELENKLKEAGKKPVVVKFCHSLSYDCLSIDPVFKALAKKVPEVIFLQVNIVKVYDVIKKYDIKKVPSFMIFKNNKLVGRSIINGPEQLQKWLKELSYGKVYEVDSVKELQKELVEAQRKLVVLEFYQASLASGSKIHRDYENFSEKFLDVVFLKADIDKAKDIVKKYKISKVPAFVYFSYNRQIGKLISDDSERLKSSIQEYRFGKVKEVESAYELESKLTKEVGSFTLVVVEFFTTWSLNCKQIQKEYESLAKQYPYIVFLKVDIEKHRDLLKKYQIRVQPTFIYFKDNKQVDKLVGNYPVQLREKAERWR